MVIPDLPLDEYRLCTFQLWKRKEMIFVVLSLVYGTRFLVSAVHPSAFNRCCAADALALVIIVYSAKRHTGGITCVGGVPSLLDKIRRDATTYFLVLATGHLLFLCFEVFTPVSDRRAYCVLPLLTTNHT